MTEEIQPVYALYKYIEEMNVERNSPREGGE